MKSFMTSTILSADGTVLYSDTSNLESMPTMWELDAIGSMFEGAAALVCSLNGERCTRYTWDGSGFVSVYDYVCA